MISVLLLACLACTCAGGAKIGDDFLAHWMGELSTVGNFDELTLLDLSLPGSHDTLSYDLSTKVSDGGADDHLKFAQVMHRFGEIVPDEIGAFIRKQAQTQTLNVTSQLDNGIRFLDLRTMYEYTDKKKVRNNADWYSLHFVQSNSPLLVYLQQVADWLNNHKTEVVVIWLSKHGNTCAKGEDQYPNTPIAVKHAFWKSIETMFDGLLLSSSSQSLNKTPFNELVKRNERAIFYVSDYEEMTSSSEKALDACLIDNRLGPSVTDEVAAAAWEINTFKDDAMSQWRNNSKNKFLLMSMSTGVPTEQIITAAEMLFLPHEKHRIALQKCTGSFHIPGLAWCPPSLLDIAALENYYKQITLEQVYTNRSRGWRFPNAIYINAVGYEGSITTGCGDDASTANAKYAYADTIISLVLFQACAPSEIHTDDLRKGACDDMQQRLDTRRAANPKRLWEDKYGRQVNFPELKA